MAEKPPFYICFKVNEQYELEKTEKVYFLLSELSNLKEEIINKVFFQDITKRSTVYNSNLFCKESIVKVNNYFHFSYFIQHSFVFTIIIRDDLLVLPHIEEEIAYNSYCSPKIVQCWPLLLNLYCLQKKRIIIYY
jgi:hypothetical protein